MGNFEDVTIVRVNVEESRPVQDSQQFRIYYDLNCSPMGDWIQQFESAIRPYLRDHLDVKISGAQMIVSGMLGTIKTLENQISTPLETANKAIRTLLVQKQIKADDNKRQLDAFLENSVFAK